jgi:hypothetical protein
MFIRNSTVNKVVEFKGLEILPKNNGTWLLRVLGNSPDMGLEFICNTSENARELENKILSHLDSNYISLNIAKNSMYKG